MEEYLDIVNEHDEVIGKASHSEIYARKLPHRIVHILLFNRKGEMALQLRSWRKSFCPLHWSTAVGGHVASGETYLEGALREFQEEIGAQAELTELFRDVYKVETDPSFTKFLRTYSTEYEGPFTLNILEVDDLQFFSIKTIQEMLARGEKFHPELKFILEKHYA